MNNDLLNILPDHDDGMNDQKLLDYLNGKLSGEEKYAVEKWMTDNEIVGDAMEGLQKIKEKKSLQEYVDQLNNNLHIQLQKSSLRKKRMRLKEYPWIYLALILILSLCVIGFIILRNYLLLRK